MANRHLLKIIDLDQSVWFLSRRFISATWFCWERNRISNPGFPCPGLQSRLLSASPSARFPNKVSQIHQVANAAGNPQKFAPGGPQIQLSWRCLLWRVRIHNTTNKPGNGETYQRMPWELTLATGRWFWCIFDFPSMVILEYSRRNITRFQTLDHLLQTLGVDVRFLFQDDSLKRWSWGLSEPILVYHHFPDQNCDLGVCPMLEGYLF